jgi:hypothetical protein
MEQETQARKKYFKLKEIHSQRYYELNDEYMNYRTQLLYLKKKKYTFSWSTIIMIKYLEFIIPKKRFVVENFWELEQKNG